MKKHRCLIEALAGALVLVAAAGCVLGQATRAAEKSACNKNLKLVSFGVLKYVIANQDRFNFDANTWKTAVSPYVADPNAFNCPVVHSGEAYSFNSALFGANSMAVTEPANTVMIYEGKDQKLDFRHEGMAVVAFVDGHVKAFSETSAQKLKWTP